MNIKLVTLALVAFTVIQSGCATSFRATGPNGGGVAAGHSLGPHRGPRAGLCPPATNPLTEPGRLDRGVAQPVKRRTANSACRDGSPKAGS